MVWLFVYVWNLPEANVCPKAGVLNIHKVEKVLFIVHNEEMCVQVPSVCLYNLHVVGLSLLLCIMQVLNSRQGTRLV